MHEHFTRQFDDTLSVMRLFYEMGSAALLRTSRCIVNILHVSVCGLPCFKTSYTKLKNILAVNLLYMIISLLHLDCISLVHSAYFFN